MGKGDKKSRRGKITIGSYGKTRLKKKVKVYSATLVDATESNKSSESNQTVVAKKVAAKKPAESKKPAEKKAVKKKEA